MRQFGMISSTVWRSKRFRQLTSDLARLTYIYMHTCTHGNSAGAYQLPPELAALDLKRNPDDVREAFEELASVNLIRYDPEEELIQLVGFFRFNAVTSRKHLAGPMRIIRDALPISPVRKYAAAELVVNLYERQKTWDNTVDAKGVFLQEAAKLVKDLDLIETLQSDSLGLDIDLLIALSEALLIDLPIQKKRKQHGNNTITDTDTTQHNTDTDRGSGGKVAAAEPPSTPPEGRRSARSTPEDVQQAIASLARKSVGGKS